MDAAELIKLASKLKESGRASKLKDGSDAIDVSIMIHAMPGVTSRVQRKKFLLNEFNQKLEDRPADLEPDFKSISTSGQTINARLSIESLKPLVEYLQDKDFQVFPNQDIKMF